MRRVPNGLRPKAKPPPARLRRLGSRKSALAGLGRGGGAHRGRLLAGKEAVHAGKKVAHAGKEIFHAGKQVFHAGKEVFHAGKEVFHAGTLVFHAGKETVHAGKEVLRAGKEMGVAGIDGVHGGEGAGGGAGGAGPGAAKRRLFNFAAARGVGAPHVGWLRRLHPSTNAGQTLADGPAAGRRPPWYDRTTSDGWT